MFFVQYVNYSKNKVLLYISELFDIPDWPVFVYVLNIMIKIHKTKWNVRVCVIICIDVFKTV